MGVCRSSEALGTTPEQASRAIDKELQSVKRSRASEFRILMLGTADSGKSTFARQFYLLHAYQNPWNPSDLIKYSLNLQLNTLEAMREVLYLLQSSGSQPSFFRAHSTQGNLEGFGAHHKSYVQLIQEAPNLEAVAAYIDTLWRETSIKQIYHDLNLTYSSASYYFDNVQRFAEPNFVCTVDDIPYVRIKTVGIYETLISAKGKTIILIDVGGQKSERRKWMKHFQQSLSTIIFCVAVNEFNMQVEEEPTVNRLMEAMNLFKECYLYFGSRLPVILFLNKFDLLTQKLPTCPFDYPQDRYYLSPDETRDPLKVVGVISDLFGDIVKTGDENFFCHVTSAVDANICRSVWKDVRTVTFKTFLVNLGM
eukprot:TRINITY_DN6473_c0_g2_i1.p1 TRINITY_DN6473_c0_g2~~TRINITY_DN6473_c0_g2_i1.p1  ORF type:complete len:366 (+),score=34.14 TRINITY_DN6473_c0_g2_i1:57-1154(+)